MHLTEYDAAWPDRLRGKRTGSATSWRRAKRIEHVGSTSVPGLAAKLIIDIVMEVADSSDEASYVAPLERHGYELRIREPDWYEHRVLKGPDTDINLHVFTVGCIEIRRMIRFRDHLRTNSADRRLYEATTRVGSAELGVHSELRGCQDGDHRGDHRSDLVRR